MSNRIYTTIYQLKGINSFSEIEKWCKKEFNSPVKHSKRHQEEFNKLSANEKFYKYKWIHFSQIQTLPIVIGGNDISFIEARAEIEYAKRKIFDNNQYLPKKDRLNTEDIDVIFFELDKNFYVVIQTSNINQIERILNLIGTEYIKGQEWILSGDLFNWLVYLYSEKDGKLNSKIEITSISGFTGTVFDNENIVSSKSMEAIDLIATRAFISTGGNLEEVSIFLKDSDNCSISCKLDSHCGALIYVNDSEFLTHPNGLEKNENLILYIYTYLIPMLREAFCNNKSKFRLEKVEFAKKIGIDVIKEIIKENKIKLDELSSVEDNEET